MKKLISQIFILLAIITLMSISYVDAVEQGFNTSLTITAEDFTAPTIPTDLVATGVATSQINLSWTASTDDVAVTGYRIYRNSVIVASTTGTTYSDTGLTASTSYAYNVEAFDSVPRYSGLSDTATGTTLVAASPSPVTGGNGTSGTNLKPNITNVITTSGQNSSTITFNTNAPAISKIYWGTTEDYELGSVVGNVYTTDHSVNISELNSGTNYFFKIEATNTYGTVETIKGSFVTENIYSYIVPNVTNFKASANNGENIQLHWNNPTKFDFDLVRVVKSDKFYPSNTSEGEIVYEGKGQNFVDQNVEVGKTYYYAIFVKDLDGKYSSGALAQALLLKAGTMATSTDPFGGIVDTNNVHPLIAGLTLADFDFIQEGRKIAQEGNVVAIDGSRNLTIILDYKKVPEVLKTIAFSLSDPEDPTSVFPFLLRVNDDKTAYEATIAPLGRDGKYGLNIVILDYKNQGMKRIEGSLRAFVFATAEGILGTNRVVGENNYYIWWLWLVVLAAVVAVVMVLNKRKHRYEA